MVEYAEASRPTGGTKVKLEYAVVFETTPNNCGAYAPDLPGCIATGKSMEDIRATIRQAISLHIESLADHGEPVPEPQMSVGEARSFHRASLADAGAPDSDTETTFGMVEVEVMASRTATA
jgi:predicted RNase H-like HicB family nuclease